jgi:hypothetical protein
MSDRIYLDRFGPGSRSGWPVSSRELVAGAEFGFDGSAYDIKR